MQNGLLVYRAHIFFEHVTPEQAFHFRTRYVVFQFVTVSHHAPLNLPDGFGVGLHDGLKFFLKCRCDEFVGIQEKDVITFGVCNEAIALHRKALPVGVFKNLGACLARQGNGVVGAAAVNHQNLICKSGAGQTSFDAVRFVFGQDRNGQRRHRHGSTV